VVGSDTATNTQAAQSPARYLQATDTEPDYLFCKNKKTAV